MIVYKAVNKLDGKIYIGQTVKNINERFKGHLRGKTYFDKSLQKYGLNNFDISIIDSASCIEELNKKEEYWIKKCNSVIPNGYNILYGGKNSTGHHRSEETKQKLRLANIGKKMSEEAKRKISETSKKLWSNPEWRKKLLVLRKGKTIITEETKRKISIANKGKRKGFKMPEEQKEKIRIGCRKVAMCRKRNEKGQFIKS